MYSYSNGRHRKYMQRYIFRNTYSNVKLQPIPCYKEGINLGYLFWKGIKAIRKGTQRDLKEF